MKEENREVKVAEILEMENMPAKDRIWTVVQILSDVENRKFALWCARRANRNNVKEITKYIDAVEEFYIFGTMTKTEFDECREAHSATYWAADYAAYRSADDAADNPAYRAAYYAAYWAAKYSASDWTAQIEYLKTAIKEELGK